VVPPAILDPAAYLVIPAQIINVQYDSNIGVNTADAVASPHHYSSISGGGGNTVIYTVAPSDGPATPNNTGTQNGNEQSSGFANMSNASEISAPVSPTVSATVPGLTFNQSTLTIVVPKPANEIDIYNSRVNDPETTPGLTTPLHFHDNDNHRTNILDIIGAEDGDDFGDRVVSINAATRSNTAGASQIQIDIIASVSPVNPYEALISNRTTRGSRTRTRTRSTRGRDLMLPDDNLTMIDDLQSATTPDKATSYQHVSVGNPMALGLGVMAFANNSMSQQ
jgi:hypothetical protein